MDWGSEILVRDPEKTSPGSMGQKASGFATLVMDVYFTPYLFSDTRHKLPEEGFRKDFQK